MDSLSVIVPAHDVAPVIQRTLGSVEGALAHFRGLGPRYAAVRAEVVVVDDGSRDDTPRLVEAFARGRDGYRLVRRPDRSSAAAARNLGVAAGGGDLLLFLDGDDLFLEAHVAECYRALEGGAADFVKTGVALSDPVHPDWRPRIRNSLVINLGIRRRCHEAVGGFPDWHLFRRVGDLHVHELDIFRGIEDVYYNKLIGRHFRGAAVAAETVRYYRYPGNSFDRQYAKFQLPLGQHREPLPEDLALQVKLSDLLTDRLLKGAP